MVRRAQTRVSINSASNLPGDQEHEAAQTQVSEEEHPGPNGQVVHAVGRVAVDRLSTEVVTQPAHEIGRGLIELSDVVRQMPKCFQCQ